MHVNGGSAPWTSTVPRNGLIDKRPLHLTSLGRESANVLIRCLITGGQTGPIRNLDNGLENVQGIEGDTEYLDLVEAKAAARVR